MEHEGTGCQPPEGPILCINNCGFFGSAATMNMCSKCHKESILKKGQVKMAASSFDDKINDGGSSGGKEPVASDKANIAVISTNRTNLSAGSSTAAISNDTNVVKADEGPSCTVASEKVEHEGAGCRTPEGPVLCINNCGFFGSAATMNMCSKCHKELTLRQDQGKAVASSFDSMTNDSGSRYRKEPVISSNADTADVSVKPTNSSVGSSIAADLGDDNVAKTKERPSRCSTCRKRVGLTGFTCRCGNIFCSLHRYPDEHDCRFDYKASARDAIAKANPVIKGDKLDRI